MLLALLLLLPLSMRLLILSVLVATMAVGSGAEDSSSRGGVFATSCLTRAAGHVRWKKREIKVSKRMFSRVCVGDAINLFVVLENGKGK